MRTPLPAQALWALAAAVALTACNQQREPEVIDTNPDPMATVLANAPKVELPPAILADKTLRCKDNSLLYVTFFQGEKLATVRTEQTGTPTRLTAPEKGQPYTADGGWKMTGNPTSVDVTIPGKGSKNCHA